MSFPHYAARRDSWLRREPEGGVEPPTAVVCRVCGGCAGCGWYHGMHSSVCRVKQGDVKP